MNNVDVQFYVWLLLRRLPLFLAVFLAVAVAGVVVALVLPPKYKAEARLLIESPQISATLARSTVPERVVEQVQSIQLEMMSRTNLLALAERFDLYRDRPHLSSDDIVFEMRSQASVEPLRIDSAGGDSAGGGTGAIAFAVSFKAREADLAANVVNEFVKIILQQNFETRAGRARDTLQFFEQEVSRLGTDLSRIDAQILTFKNENNSALPDSLTFRRSQQANQHERLQQLDREEASLRDRRSRLLQFFDASDGTSLTAAGSPRAQTLEQLRRALVEQRMIFSETSSGIAALRAQIAALEREVQAEKTTVGASGMKTGRPSEKDLQLADIDGRLAFIAQEKAIISKTLADLDQSIAATPTNETTLNALERERQNLQTQYNLAIARLADASTGQQIELRSKGERLSLLEEAVPPEEPVSPKRLVIALGGFVGGLGLATGLIVLLELLNKTVRRPTDLEVLELQALVTVPYIDAPGETKKGRFW